MTRSLPITGTVLAGARFHTGIVPRLTILLYSYQIHKCDGILPIPRRFYVHYFYVLEYMSCTYISEMQISRKVYLLGHLLAHLLAYLL